MINVGNLQKPKRSTVLKTLGALLLVAIVLPFVVFAFPSIVGAEGGYVVISSSMSPTINAGDVVIVNGIPATSVHEGDIITFGDGEQDATPEAERGTELITHRVIDIRRTEQGLAFKTKGDANEKADLGLVQAEALVGRVMFSIPFIGYVITFANTDLGFITLVAIPLGLLMLGELYDLARAARNSRETSDVTDEQAETDGGTDADEWVAADETEPENG